MLKRDTVTQVIPWIKSKRKLIKICYLTINLKSLLRYYLLSKTEQNVTSESLI